MHAPIDLTCDFKCDLRIPACQRCIDAGIKCPGPLQGPIILISDQGQPPVKPISTHRNFQKRAPAQPSPSTPLVLQRKATSSLLLSTFVHYLAHSARRSSWTFSLLSLATDTQPHTLSFRSALNAVSLAHFAHTTSDDVFDVHATREYGRALAYHRQALTRLSVTDAGLEATLKQCLLTCTLLSYYELIAAINPVAWGIHVEACEKLLCIMGTRFIQDDVFVRQLAVSVRSHAILRSTIYAQNTVFASDPWLLAAQQWTKSQEQSIARDAYDWVVEFVLRMSQFQRDHPRSPDGKPDPRQSHAGETFEKELQTNYDDFLLSLEPPVFPACLPLFESSSSSEQGLAPPPVLPTGLRKQFPSMAFAYFHSAALLHRHYYSRPGGPPQSRNEDWIAGVARYLEQDSRTNATGILRMGFPFAMIWLCSRSSTELRQRFRDVFERWCRREGMLGLGVLIFP